MERMNDNKREIFLTTLNEYATNYFLKIIGSNLIKFFLKEGREILVEAIE